MSTDISQGLVVKSLVFLSWELSKDHSSSSTLSLDNHAVNHQTQIRS